MDSKLGQFWSEYLYYHMSWFKKNKKKVISSKMSCVNKNMKTMMRIYNICLYCHIVMFFTYFIVRWLHRHCELVLRRQCTVSSSYLGQSTQVIVTARTELQTVESISYLRNLTCISTFGCSSITYDVS